MPRITLPRAAGEAASLFDSWDPATAGQTRVYWLGALPPDARGVANRLEAWETLLHVVLPASAAVPGCDVILDRGGELAAVFDVALPFVIVVDAAGRIAGLLTAPDPETVLTEVSRLHRASAPLVVQSRAPVLLLDRVFEAALCQRLIACWRAGGKRDNEVGSAAGNLVNADVKRRQDVEIADSGLFVEVRDCLVRRVAPAILQAFQIQIAVIEGPRIGCYDASSGRWFRRHRDNTSRATAHRQFALSLNLNEADAYDGGEVRFPEYGRELYRRAWGGAMVFSSSLLHEVVPVIRGRRFGLFTFMSATAPGARRGF